MASAPLPSWVPEPGSVALLTTDNGLLANTFRSQVAPFFGEFYFVNTVNAYSGAFKNPHWGTYGATVFWGGGHAGCNDNTVTVAEYGASAVTFKRMSKPTAWTGSEATDETNRGSNSNGDWTATQINTTYREAISDGQPGSPHSYCSGDILGPADGGGTYGSLIQVVSAAVMRDDTAGALAAHRIDFNTLTLAQSGSDRKWVRHTNNTGAFSYAAPMYTVHVPAQQRIYIFHQGGGLPATPKWFDLATNTYVTGTGADSFEVDAADGFDSGIMFHVPSRNLIVGCWPVSNSLVVQWMDVSVSQPDLGGTATLSSSLAVSDPWSMACWCKDNNRIIVGGVNSDSGALYEIEIPATLTNTWTVTRRALPSGTMPKGDTTVGLTYKKFEYDEKIKSIFYMPIAQRSVADGGTGVDQAWVYRPLGT